MTDCYCSSLADLAVVPMGCEGLDEKVFLSLETVREHGGKAWWLYLSKCRVCSQGWLVAQDDRIYDDFFMRRVSPAEAQGIIHGGSWPDDFMTYERVLSTGRRLSRPCEFLDPLDPSLISTAGDLRSERPDIAAEEIGYLLGLNSDEATRLVTA